MSNLEGVGLEFEESMSGWIGIGEKDPKNGRILGERNNTSLRFDVRISIADLSKFLNISDHSAQLDGTVTIDALGGKFNIRKGLFNLFSIDATDGIRHMTYSFCFTASDGKNYFLHGHKEIKDDPGPLDVVSDMTTLFTLIRAGEDETAPIYGAGEIYFKLIDTPSLVSSMKITGATWWGQEIAAKMAFMSFAFGILRQEYLRDFNPLYDTKYENLVVSGKIASESQVTGFFLVSGIHDRDFPWGDGEVFSDALLVTGDSVAGYQRYCITDRALNGLQLNVEKGFYKYDGPIFEITDGNSASFSQMHNNSEKLKKCHLNIEISFRAKPFATTPLPFLVADEILAELSYKLKQTLGKYLPSENELGIHITPHTVEINEGQVRITKEASEAVFAVLPDKTFGEAEVSTFRNVKEPTMLYNYICAISPETQSSRIQIQSDSFRNDKHSWTKDRLDAWLGAIIRQFVSNEMYLTKDRLIVNNLNDVPRFLKIGAPLIEVNNDHFPTAVFQRRIIEVLDCSGTNCLALEENMNPMRLDAINSGRKVKVAVIRKENKFQALEDVLNATGFWEFITGRFISSNKSVDDFSVVIKPNFMFAYNKADRSTFTDPELVAHLTDLLRTPKKSGTTGFENITVVEAQSTYGQYFDKRSVKEVAEYVGYDITESLGYKVVDLTEDDHDEQLLGAHLGKHPVPITWRDADFRISFAKNKTHAYACYTLTLKNIYGALPLPNKFKEYHCDRDIYHTTIEYLQKFPVDYGLIDAFLSADGPFGIFADSEPNPTNTIIGGSDLVAVDWIAATKMGIDPMISKYMQLAVQAFGKPEIELIGDPNPYFPWLNVPTIMTLFTHYGLDANHYFGNLLYMTGAYMDESHFKHKSKSEFIKAAREVVKPIQQAVFLQAGGDKTLANKILNRFLTKLGE